MTKKKIAAPHEERRAKQLLEFGNKSLENRQSVVSFIDEKSLLQQNK